MKILFIVPSYKPAYIYGGPIVVIAQLAETLIKLGHQVTVYTTTANGATELDVVSNQMHMVDGVSVFYFERITKDHTHTSTALWSYLNKTVVDFDVVHLHSWWNFLVLGAAWICQRKGVTPILSPHGMFSTYILQTNHSLPKKLLHSFIGKRLLKRTKVHVSTQMELDECRNIVPNWEGEIIPNPVILSAKTYHRKENDVFTIGFLSRIDPKKGLDVLLKALSAVSFPFELHVAGTGEEEYVKSLQNLALNLGIASSVTWLGWKKGQDKFDFLSDVDLFALTSHSENFAIVVIEALSVGTPVLVSNQVGLHMYVMAQDYGWVCDMDVAKITQQLNTLVMEKNKIERINRVAPKEVEVAYNDENLARAYIEFYKTIK